jgi:AhpD family alkylhydroperoxidase
MTVRINYSKHSGEAQKKLLELGQILKSSIEPTLMDLIDIRASQLNGCAFCLDMHVKEAKIHGERELRLYHISVWRESQLFTERERAALLWTETVTQLNGHGISEDVFKNVSEHLSEKELSDLTYAIGMINFWNRLNISSPQKPGSLDVMFGLNKAELK